MAQQRRIIEIHLEGSERHQHITNVVWIDPRISPTSRVESTKQQMVDFINDNPGQTFVYDEPTRTKVLVGVVDSTPPYIRTYRDNEWQDNLLDLKKY
jgi:hypothetical protein